MKKLVLIIASIALVFVPLTYRVDAAPNNQPLFATLQLVQEKISQAVDPIQRKLNVVSSQVNDLEGRVDEITFSNCATCSAQLVKAVNESSVINDLETIYLAQLNYIHAPDAEKKVATLWDLEAVRLVDDELAMGIKHGYLFDCVIDSQAKKKWHCVATPRKLNRTGDRAFFIDETGIIRFETTASAIPTAKSDPLED